MLNDVIPVVSLAMQHVNANASILSNYDLDIMTFNGRCMASVVMHKFINIITSRDYKVVEEGYPYLINHEFMCNKIQ